MSSTFGGSRSSAELPVVCLLVGAPGFDPGRLQQSAAPVYKTEPHASADAVIPGCATLRKWRAVRDSNPSRSIDSRAASPHWSMEDASGYDPHAYGLKVRSLSIWV